MRRRLAVLTLLGAMIAGASAPAPAHACSLTPDFDAWGTSDLIVSGRIAGIELPPGGGSAARVRMTVDRTFKGTSPGATLEFLDQPTSCGLLLGGEAVGTYLIIGLAPGEGGEPEAFSGRVFFTGPNPEGDDYGHALARVEPIPTNGPVTSGANAIVIKGGGPAMFVASKLAEQTGRPVLALWALFDGRWAAFVPAMPRAGAGLGFFPFESPVAAVAVLG